MPFSPVWVPSAKLTASKCSESNSLTVQLHNSVHSILRGANSESPPPPPPPQTKSRWTLEWLPRIQTRLHTTRASCHGAKPQRKGKEGAEAKLLVNM